MRTAERSSILNLSLKKTSLPTFDIRCLLINRNPKDTPRSGAGVKMPKLRIELGTFTSGARRSPNWAIAAATPPPPPPPSPPRPTPCGGALQRESKGAQGGRGRGGRCYRTARGEAGAGGPGVGGGGGWGKGGGRAGGGRAGEGRGGA